MKAHRLGPGMALGHQVPLLGQFALEPMRLRAVRRERGIPVPDLGRAQGQGAAGVVAQQGRLLLAQAVEVTLPYVELIQPCVHFTDPQQVLRSGSIIIAPALSDQTANLCTIQPERRCGPGGQRLSGRIRT